MYVILVNFLGDDLIDIMCDLVIMLVKSSVFFFLLVYFILVNIILEFLMIS